MADNITLNPGTGGETVATDDDGGAQHQYVKLEFGADGTQTKVDATNPLPVTPAVVSTSSSGTATATNGAATMIVSANATRKSCLLYTLSGASTVYIGVGQTATSAMMPLLAATPLVVECVGAISARNDSGAAVSIRYMDESY